MSDHVTFWSDESGAVTVDWVVMTGGVVGLGLATMAVVSGGVENLSGDIARQLSSDGWNLFDNGLQNVASFDFTGGDAEGWLGGTVMDMGGSLGELLVLGPGETTSFWVDVAEGTDQAIMQFDLIAGDSIDSSEAYGYDTATIMLNGTPVAFAMAEDHEAMTFEIPQIDGTTVEATVTVEEQDLGGNPSWTDSAATVTVTVDQPTEPIQFAVDSDSNQSINDEFWGLDNFDASTTGGPGF